MARAGSERGWTEDEASSRISAQAARAERLAAATYVVDNSGTLEDLRQRVTEVFGELVGTPAGEPALRRLDRGLRDGGASAAPRVELRTRSAEMPCRRPMSASLCWRPSSKP